MANRRVMKLFAATVVASTSTASASPASWASYIDTSVKPRLIGQRPAPGNTAGGKSKGGASRAAEMERVPGLTYKQLAELEPIDLSQPTIDLRIKVTPEPIVIRPRRLANARPACGNTGGKSDGPAADCSVADIRLALELDKWEMEQASKRDAKFTRDAQTLFAAATAIITADPSLKARLYVDGRPACGNTQGKAAPASYCRIGDAQ